MSYTQLAPSDFVVSIDTVTAPAWSSNQPVLSTFYTASTINTTGISQGAFYLDVYQTASAAQGSAVQFSIAYGHINGSGSQYFNNLVPGVSPSLITYKQYRTLVYGTQLTSSNQGFNFGGASTNAPHIAALSIDRNRYKESLFPGTFNLHLRNGSQVLKLTDNSNDVSTLTFLDCGRVFDIVSGSNGNAKTTLTVPGQIAPGYTASGSYGYFLPDIGTIILNAGALALSVPSGGLALSFNTSANISAPNSSPNNTLVYQAISSSAYFQLNSQESVASDYIFARIGNADYNYTTNPTFVSSSGEVIYSTLINNPQTYMTTVGLYNTSNELLAVAKMSRPLVKDFTKEALLRIKLDW